MEEKELDNGKLISMVRMRGLKPSQVFKTDEIMDDPEFKKAIKSEVDYQRWLESQKIEEEIEKYEKKEIEEYEKMEKENELIPGPKPEGTEKKEKHKKELDDNELIPDVDDSGSSSQDDDDSLIPD